MASLRVTPLPQLQTRVGRALWTFVVHRCLSRSFLQLKDTVPPFTFVQLSQMNGVTLGLFVRRRLRCLLPWASGATSPSGIRFVPELTSGRTLFSGAYPDAVAVWRSDECFTWGGCGATPLSAK